jgi:hypothetical protein
MNNQTAAGDFSARPISGVKAILAPQNKKETANNSNQYCRRRK